MRNAAVKNERFDENVHAVFEKVEETKKIRAYAFPAAEVRANMPSSRKKIVAQRSVQHSASPLRSKIEISEFNHGPLAGSQHRKQHGLEMIAASAIRRNRVTKTMNNLKDYDIFTKIQWYVFQIALLVIFVVTLFKFVKWLL